MIAFTYFALENVKQFSNNEMRQNISQFAAIRQIIDTQIKGNIPLRWSDLPKYSERAQQEYGQLDQQLWNNVDQQTIEEFRPSPFDRAITERDKTFSETQITGSTIAQSVSMPYAFGKECDVAIITGNPSPVFEIISVISHGGVYRISGTDSRILVFPKDCYPDQRNRVSVIIFKTQEGRVIAALPKWYAEQMFPEFAKIPGFSWPSVLKSDISEFVPKNVANYLDLESQYFTLDTEGLELRAMYSLSQLNNRNYLRSEWKQALLAMYDGTKAVNVSVPMFGLSIAMQDLLRFTPFALFLLTYPFWRLIRQINPSRTASGALWMPIDTSDFIGFIGGLLWALGPLLIFLQVYLLYPEANGFEQVMFGYEVTFHYPFGFNFMPARGPGWYNYDFVSSIILGFAIVHAVLITAITKKTFDIVLVNQRFRLTSLLIKLTKTK